MIGLIFLAAFGFMPLGLCLAGKEVGQLVPLPSFGALQ